MNQTTSPVTEDYWSHWIESGDAWRALSPEKKATILEMPVLLHTDDRPQPNFHKSKIERRPEILKLKPPGADPTDWLVVCRLMQIYYSAGPAFSGGFDAKQHADFLGRFVFCELAWQEFHKGTYRRYSFMIEKLEIDPARFGSLRRLNEFLDIPAGKSGADWEKAWSEGASPSDRLGVFSGQHVTECARRMLERVVASQAPVPLLTLSRELADYHRGGLFAKALRSLTNHVLIVFEYDRSLGDLVAGLWPPLRRRMDRPNSGSAPPASCKETSASFGHPFLLDDLAAVVLAASAEPLPIKQSGLLEIYAAKVKELNQTLTPVPEWVRDRLYQKVPRIQIAVGAAFSLGFLKRNQKTSLLASTEGTRWLGLDTSERCRAVLDKLMQRCWKRNWNTTNWNFCQPCGKFRTSRLESDIIPLEAGLAKAFLQLPKDGSHVPLQEFLEFASEHFNPLFETVGRDGFVFVSVPGAYGGWDWKRREAATLAPEILTEMRAFLETRLIPLGAVAIGKSGKLSTVALTGIGRYFLGATKTLRLADEPAAGRIVVQPNFEIVFLGPNLRAEAGLSPFCERVGSGTGPVFRLTKASVQTALHRGLDIGSLTKTLNSLAKHELPQNVLAEMSGWGAARQTYTVESIEVLRCASPETALHVHTLLPHSTKILGGPCLEVVHRLKGPDKNRLEKSGFFKNT